MPADGERQSFRPRRHCGTIIVPTVTATAPKPIARLDVDLDEVESRLRSLLQGYAGALRFAANMPLFGRSPVSGTRLGRWGSRFFTRVYVETHVRKQLEAIRACLRLLRVDATTEDDPKRLDALDEQLADQLEPLFGWRRVFGLLARLPPVAAALPIISAAAAWPLGEVSRRTLISAVLILLATWILVIWPSIKMGFRIKRVILAGGGDFFHPFFHRVDWRTWDGFSAPSFYDDDRKGATQEKNSAAERASRLMPFPTAKVYAAENAVFRALGRRKPGELPLDLLLGLGPYLWFAYSVFWFWGLVDVVLEGELGETMADSGLGVVIGGVIALVFIALPIQGRRSYRDRPH